jgi:hypothetical protein
MRPLPTSDLLPSWLSWRGVGGAGVAFEAELTEASAEETESDELGAVRPGYARSFPVLADQSAARALRGIDALVEDNLVDDAAGCRCWIATSQQESPAQKQAAQGFASVRHAQKSNAYG